MAAPVCEELAFALFSWLSEMVWGAVPPAGMPPAVHTSGSPVAHAPGLFLALLAISLLLFDSGSAGAFPTGGRW